MDTQTAPNHRSPTNRIDRKSTRLNSSHSQISYAVFCLKEKIQRYFKARASWASIQTSVPDLRPARSSHARDYVVDFLVAVHAAAPSRAVDQYPAKARPI